MAGLSENLIVAIVFFTIGMVLVVIWLMRALSHRRKRLLEELREGQPDFAEDAAHNQILTTTAILRRAEEKGTDVTVARSLLNDAKKREKVGDYQRALSLAKEARTALGAVTSTSASTLPRVRVPASSRPADREEILLRDIARESKGGAKSEVRETVPAPMAGKQDADPAASPSIPELRKNVPKNQLESRFEINLLEEALKGTEEGSNLEARKLLGAATKTYSNGDYTEALRLAMRGRRLMKSQAVETITLSPATTVETPPEQPLPSAVRSSAPAAEKDVEMEADTGRARPTSVRCPRCARENPSTNKFCRGCGKPLAEPTCPRCQKPISLDDAFCGVCGAPTTGLA